MTNINQENNTTPKSNRVSRLLDALLHVKSTVPMLQSGTTDLHPHGICFQISGKVLPRGLYQKSNLALFGAIATLWPKYSGNHMHPVPSTLDGCSPVDLYYNVENCWVGEYGALRIELLDWCIEYCKQLLVTNQSETEWSDYSS